MTGNPSMYSSRSIITAYAAEKQPPDVGAVGVGPPTWGREYSFRAPPEVIFGPWRRFASAEGYRGHHGRETPPEVQEQAENGKGIEGLTKSH